MTIKEALKSASDTRACVIAVGALSQAGDVFRQQFPGADAVVVADLNTFPIACREVQDQLKGREPFIFDDPSLYAESGFVEKLEQSLKKHDAIPIAVGSGTINDLTKLAAHRVGRPYMCVATAASMDGYTAFGASITHKGSKQTFNCPAPRAVIADLDIISAAPQKMNAAGYADLLAKFTAGADWIVADALGIESIDKRGWEMMQSRLREWTIDPQGVKAGKPEAISNLLEGLLMGGFAMQWTKSSRVASGAEHQFSHLWDMQHHTHHGATPSHGFKVGIGTLASATLYSQFYDMDLFSVDTKAWPVWGEIEGTIQKLFSDPLVAAKAIEETKAKYVDQKQLQVLLRKIETVWPDLKRRLKEHLPAVDQLRDKLREAGAPFECEQIGISRQKLNQSHLQAYFLRRRYTVLDLAVQTGRWVEWAGQMA